MNAEKELQLAEDFYEQAGISVQLASGAVSIMEKSRPDLIGMLIKNGAKEDKAKAAVQALCDEQRASLRRALEYFAECEKQVEQARRAVRKQQL